VSGSCKLQAAEQGQKGHGGVDADEAGPEATEGSSCFIAELERQTEIEAPGAVIVPIAILK
jgi:hypothetical protein